MQKLQPWQYSGTLTESDSQPYLSPTEFINKCQVNDIESAKTMQALILEKLCLDVHSTKKKNLFNATLKILQREYSL